MNIVEEYKSALGNYLHNGGEESLRRAYELGRKAIAEDLGSIDMIITHQQALQELLRAARTADDSAQLTEAASTFLAEMFSPFEMTFLGFRDALNTIQQSEERYRTMIESAQDVIYTLSTDGIIKSLNPVFEKVTGWKPSDWIG